jgi:hypothetical protein
MSFAKALEIMQLRYSILGWFGGIQQSVNVPND